MNIIEHLVPHRSSREDTPISAIVLHDTGARTAASTLSWFDRPESGVSSHYLVDRDGTTYLCVPEAEKAWHAGLSALWGLDDVNAFSVGIELVDADNQEPYPDEQINALIALTADIASRHGVWLNRIVGHEHVCVPPGRKVDPGVDFDWHNFLLAVAARILARGD